MKTAITSAGLTDRYVGAVARRVPEAHRADAADQVRALVASGIQDRLARVRAPRRLSARR